jgi:hypothetical protein
MITLLVFKLFNL